MPTNLVTLLSTELTVPSRAPRLSEALNRKALITPQGIYKGFRIETSASALSVTIAADPLTGDHLAHYHTPTGYGVTVRRTDGDLTLSLAAFANKTVVLALFVDYTPVADTYGYLRAYELSPTDTFTSAVERPNLIVLGEVVVPASGAIPDVNINYAYRSEVIQTAATLVPLLQDPTFELVGPISSAPTWSVAWFADSSVDQWLVAAGVHSGSREMRLVPLAAAGSATLKQAVFGSVRPGGLVRLRAWVRRLVSCTSFNTQIAVASTDDNEPDSVVIQYSDTGTSVDASYREIVIQTRVRWASGDPEKNTLSYFSLQLSYTGAPIGTPVFAVDSIQVEYENAQDGIVGYAVRGAVNAMPLVVSGSEPRLDYVATDSARITMESGTLDVSEQVTELQLHDSVLHIAEADSNTNPLPTTYVKNTLYAKSMIKAWGCIKINDQTLVDGVNVDSLGWVETNVLGVSLVESFASTSDFMVLVTTSTHLYTPKYVKAGTGFAVALYDYAGVIVTAATWATLLDTETIDFIVMGTYTT